MEERTDGERQDGKVIVDDTDNDNDNDNKSLKNKHGIMLIQT